MPNTAASTPENVSATPQATPAVPKPHAPTPAALAKTAPKVANAQAAGSQEELAQAESFGRVADDGTVFVREGESERAVGQYADTDAQSALRLFATRYLDLKARLQVFATRLSSPQIKIREIDESLKNLTQELVEPAVVGDIAALKEQLASLSEEAQKRKEEITEARKAAVAKAIEERTAIVEQAEALAQSLGNSTNWRQTADKFRELFEQWQAHQRSSVRIDRAQADELWKRFSAARTSFNQARRKWAQSRDAQRAQAKSLKEAIIEQAESLKDSTDWANTSRQFNELMEQWKQSGRAGRQEDDALWARFRAAADTFFNARQADRDQTSQTERDNLAKKEALLVKAEALVPVHDEQAAKQAREALAAIQEEWDAIGFVPRQEVRRIESRLDAVEQQIKAAEDAVWSQTDPETDARKSEFTAQLEAQLAQLDQQIAAETDEARKAKLQAERATKEQWLNAVR